ncbi:MAG: biopolymer transporter ExbD [Bdellovibrionota bacterium]
MRRRGMKKYMDKRSPSTFKIQITSMVDMFVILLVFLLKSYSTSPVIITPSEGMTLPASTSAKDPVDSLKLMVSKSGVWVEDKKIIDLKDGAIDVKDVDPSDTQFIRSLYTELDTQASKTRTIASKNDTIEFDGKVLMQADRGLNYETLRKVMYTAMMAGYSDVKIAVLSKD